MSPDHLDSLPEWAKTAISVVIGAGGLQLFKAWLENRRLSKKEFRETLLDRIRELEQVISQTHTRMGNLRVEMAHLQVENKQLRHEIEALEEEYFPEEDHE